MLKEISAKVISVQDGNDVWYIGAYGDVTHLYMANNPEALQTNSASVLHIGQLGHKPYYEEVSEWLREQYHGKPLEKTKFDGHEGITLSQVDDQLITALEGGSNYWYNLKTASSLEEPEGYKRNRSVHYRFLDKVYQGATLPVYDIEEPTEVLGDLSMETIKRGLDLLKRDYKDHYRDVVDECGDAETADVLFQLMVMGEVTFG